jgi:hypothetical protein
MCLLGVVFCAVAVRAQATAPVLLPAPTGAELARGRALVRQVFAEGFGKTGAGERRALARTLMAQARDTRDDAVARYALVVEASDLAAGAADAATACGALDAAARLYAVDNLLDRKRQALMKASAALGGNGMATDAEALMRAALATAQEAAQADAFEAVVQLANLAEGAANKTLKVSVVSSIQGELQGLREMAAEYEKVRGALARVGNAAGGVEGEADCLRIGRFYALRKGQWERGLPFLARGPEGVLRELALKEQAAANSETAGVQAADGWWDFGQQAAGVERAQALAHAQALYRQAESRLKGITLARIQARLGPGGGEVVQGNGAAVNLLALVDTGRDGCAGTWAPAGGGVACEAGPYATLQLPFALPEEYDLAVSFTRVEGSGPVALLLTAGGRAFGFSVDTRGEARFERVNGKVSQDNPTVVPVAVSNGRAYTVTVQVRKEVVRALLDGKVLVEHKPEAGYRELSRYPSWKVADTALPGVGAHLPKVPCHRIEVVELTGKGKPAR